MVGLLQDNDIVIEVCSTFAIHWHYECIIVRTLFQDTDGVYCPPKFIPTSMDDEEKRHKKIQGEIKR